MSKLDKLERSLDSLDMDDAVKLFVDERDSDIAPFCAEGEGEDACIVRYGRGRGRGKGRGKGSGKGGGGGGSRVGLTLTLTLALPLPLT